MQKKPNFNTNSTGLSRKFINPIDDFKCSSRNNLSDILYNNAFQNLPIEDDFQEDETLTSLNWLNNISIPLSSSIPVNEEYIPTNIFSINSNSYNSNRNQVYDKNLLQYFPSKLQAALRSEGLFDPLIRYEYKTSWKNKPPLSYTTLICMAMLDLGKPKIALNEIYEWIRENFLYYRKSDSSWQNSVRHNLSLKKCFEKVPRRKDERGKGGFWRINPNFTENLGNNFIKYRRQFQIYSNPPNYYQTNGSVYNFNQISSDWKMNNKSTNEITYLKRTNDYQYNTSSFTYENINQKPFIKSHSKPVFKKPYALSSLNQFETIEENDHVIAQMRLYDSPKPRSPTLYSLTENEPLLSEISPNNSNYSTFGFEDFDSTTSSSFDTDFSCSSNFHTSSDDSYSLHLPLDIDEFIPQL